MRVPQVLILITFPADIIFLPMHLEHQLTVKNGNTCEKVLHPFALSYLCIVDERIKSINLPSNRNPLLQKLGAIRLPYQNCKSRTN